MKFLRLADFALILTFISACQPTPILTPSPTPPPAPTPTLTALPWVHNGQILSNTGHVRCANRQQPPMLYPAANGGLRELAESGGVWVGTAVGAIPLRGVNAYSQAAAREFNLIVPEVALKFERVQPEPGVYNFCEMDTIAAFAQANAMRVRGHPLVWEQQLPSWVRELDLPDDQWEILLHDHLTQLITRYAGIVEDWDVINEPLTEEGTLKETLWYKNLGPEYIERVLRWAEEANPDARLFINEFATENLNAKSDALFAMAQDLLARGVPLHGIGFQMHLSLTDTPDPKQVAANFQRFADLGLEVQITELDVRIWEPVTQDELELQAKIFQDMVTTCLNAPNCNTVVVWGINDSNSWVRYLFSANWGSPLILGDDYLPKPAYWAFMEALKP